ncbi:MAG: hypothetical protein KKB08_04205 [Gammaproteobacteria bacterium]|nr:hypothetical protein [Gammaproteobacteria bacterium]
MYPNLQSDTRQRTKEPLFRKVHTTAHRVHHGPGSDYSEERNARRKQYPQATRQPMHARRVLGRDYTPLFRFLLSNVGKNWSSIYSEALARLDRPDPIFWLVALREAERRRCVLVGESSYHSGLYVDETGTLQVVHSLLGPSVLV